MIAAPLKILIDATPLGSGADPGVGHAGIFRVAQGFIAEACRRGDLDVTLAAIDSFFAEAQLVRYLRREAHLQTRWVSAWEHSSMSLADAVALLDDVAAAGEGSAAGQRLMATMALANRTARPRPRPDEFDIYQSMRHALADRTRVRARARALVVYDLVPLRFPNFAGDGFAAAMHRVLASFVPASDWALAISACTRADFCAHLGINGRRVFVMPLAADPTLFQPVADRKAIAAARARHGLGPGPYILSVGTIEPRKNLAHLIDAFADLVPALASGDALALVLVGAAGWKTSAVTAALERLPAAIRARVHLPGHVPDRDLAPLYSGADVVVYPSHFEGFGLPVLEAMQCGAPVVTTTGGALPEVAGDGALLVDAGDRAALVRAILDARGNRRLAAAGRARAAAFTWTTTLDLTVAAYRIMLSG